MFARDFGGKSDDMDRLSDADQPSRARLEQKMQKSGAAENFEFVREFAGLKKVARRSLQSEDRMAVHGLLEKAFNLVSKWDAEARLEEALYALLDSLDAPVSLKKGEAFAVVIYCVAPNVDDTLHAACCAALHGRGRSNFVPRRCCTA
jgi:hypothetical protein